ncbi:MAG: hypothetical protein APF77_12560 [Clostridia bacterium BRH_c25]|nr:MAG: hypothetical protein APF77_12560 [Clostridia bacterium BRH_c25]
MIIRVGAFGSQKSLPKVLEAARKIPELLITPHTYKMPEECPFLVKEAGNYDVLLFTGPIPYFLSAKEIKKKNTPAVYVKWDDYNFALSLLNLKFNRDCCDRMSVDIPEEQSAYRMLRETGINSLQLYVKEINNTLQDGNEGFNTEAFVDFHVKLWNEAKVDICITSIAAVELRLNQMGIACFRMPALDKTIMETLEKVLSIGELNFNKNMQITIGYIEVDDYEKLSENSGSGFDKLMPHHYQKLLEWGEKINGVVQYLDRDSFMIYMTRLSLDYVTNNFKELPIIADLKNVSLSIGFGLGMTAKEAEESAKIAVSYAKEAGGNCGFIVLSDEKVIGPLNKNIKKFEYKTENINYMLITQKTGIGIVNLSKMMEFLKLNKFTPFSSKKLADYLQVSQRSCERIIKKLVDSNYAHIVGYEQPYKTGRPRALYVANFNQDL